MLLVSAYNYEGTLTGSLEGTDLQFNRFLSKERYENRVSFFTKIYQRTERILFIKEKELLIFVPFKEVVNNLHSQLQRTLNSHFGYSSITM